MAQTWTPIEHGSAASILGEGIHTGMRKGSDDPGAPVLWAAVNDNLQAWSDALDFFVWGLDYMGMAICKKTEVDV